MFEVISEINQALNNNISVNDKNANNKFDKSASFTQSEVSNFNDSLLISNQMQRYLEKLELGLNKMKAKMQNFQSSKANTSNFNGKKI